MCLAVVTHKIILVVVVKLNILHTLKDRIAFSNFLWIQVWWKSYKLS